MEEFYKSLDKHVESLNYKFQDKFSVKQLLYDDIMLVLQDGWGDSQLKFWVNKNFKIIKIGDQSVVYDIKSNHPVVRHENLYTKIKECHERVGHHGRDKTWIEVKDQYGWVPLDTVKLFISQCDVCSNRKTFPKPAAEKPIVSIGYFTRLQVDLIDMRSIPNGEYKWILHAKDHFTKFLWTYPLQSKEAEPVAQKFLQQFYSFGAPRILQSDNGKEFVAKVIKDLQTTWTNLIIINGRPRHPQTQGLVERGNQTLESVLGKWMQSNNRNDWSKAVAYAINTSSAQTIKKSPYDVVFGQKPRCDIEMWQVLSDQGILNEEELPLDFIDLLNEFGNATSVVEVAMSSDATKSPAAQVQSLQATVNLYLPVAPSPTVHISPRTKKWRQARLFSNDQVTYIDKGKAMRYSLLRECCMLVISLDEATDTEDATLVTNHTQIRSEAEVSYMANIAKRQKLFNDVVDQKEYKVGDLVCFFFSYNDLFNYHHK
ncbi:unnamed protein product [Rotaria magnacalcarata]|uniref:Integrase catalytic domain-containing protein n=2 Tax=Rotaria magnacalcarata TaxID=392030 RepID=A0A815YH90_9BILA|nr:unnamed protein product [Rotaria magnacalcarata]